MKQARIRQVVTRALGYRAPGIVWISCQRHKNILSRHTFYSPYVRAENPLSDVLPLSFCLRSSSVIPCFFYFCLRAPSFGSQRPSGPR